MNLKLIEVTNSTVRGVSFCCHELVAELHYDEDMYGEEETFEGRLMKEVSVCLLRRISSI